MEVCFFSFSDPPSHLYLGRHKRLYFRAFIQVSGWSRHTFISHSFPAKLTFRTSNNKWKKLLSPASSWILPPTYNAKEESAQKYFGCWHFKWKRRKKRAGLASNVALSVRGLTASSRARREGKHVPPAPKSPSFILWLASIFLHLCHLPTEPWSSMPISFHKRRLMPNHN